jgi:adenylate cyclase class 2
MHYEVEMKFRCDDLARVRAALVALGARGGGEPVEQVDQYYRHPVRDFARTDEAFRLRRVGEQNFMTYKGPKIDGTTKTRYEQETRLADGEATFRGADDTLRRLSFEPVAAVRKQRQSFHIVEDGVDVEATLDEVAGVGAFVELEASIDAPRDDAEPLDAARRALALLAARLGLSDAERRSYLELLLQTASS